MNFIGQPFILLIILLVLSIMVSCKDEPVHLQGPTEASLIGYNPCTKGMDNGPNKGFVLKLATSDDTVKVFNLPDSLFEPHRFHLPPEVFSGYRATYLFPDSIRENYKFEIVYERHGELPIEDSILCTADIWLQPYNSDTEYAIEVKKILNL